jgi:beta-lactamase class A
LVRRAIVDSDSAAVDIMIDKLGGQKAVQGFLERKSIRGIRLDRDEKHLQTEIAGLEWRPEFVDPALLKRAIDSVPEARRDASYRQYQSDPRDTASARGMSSFLFALAEGRLLSPASTAYVLKVMTETVTFPDRLKAGVPGGWTLGHKTGSSGGWKGVTAATNDVGVLTAPDGGRVAIVVFIGDSRESATSKAALMARAAKVTTAHFE